MPSNNRGTSATRRRVLVGLAGLAAFATATKMAWSADPEPGAPQTSSMIKRASLLGRKPGLSHEQFVKHWVEIHAPLLKTCPGISRYTLTIIKSSSMRKGMPAYEIEVDGIAEFWFKNQAAYESFQNSPITKKVREDGETFIGREIDFLAEEQVVIS